MNHPPGQGSGRRLITLTVPKTVASAARIFAAVALAALVSSCASTSIDRTWKSPDYKSGPLQKVAVVADHDRMNVRVALENRFVRQLDKASQPAFATGANYPDLKKARENKEATVA